MKKHEKRRRYLIKINDRNQSATYPLLKYKGVQALSPDPLADGRSVSSATQIRLKRSSPFGNHFYEELTRETMQSAVQHLLELPSLVPDGSFVAQMIMLTLGAKINDRINDTPTAPPVIQLGAVSSVPAVLPLVFEVLQGPQVWEGRRWRLKRPWVLCSQMGKFSNAPSTTPLDYVGGKLRFHKKRLRFWLPYCNAVFAVQPSVPASVVREIVEFSPLASPVLCGQKVPLGRTEIRLDATNACALDVEQAEKIADSTLKIFCFIHLFTYFIRAKNKRVRKVVRSAERYLPMVQSGRFTQVSQDPKDRALALGLSVFERVLLYAEENGLLDESDHESVLQHFWALTFPDRQPADESLTLPDAWRSPNQFWMFLKAHLEAATCAVPNEKRSAEVGAAVVQIKDEYLLIVPTASVLYVRWLEAHGIPGPAQSGAWETAVFHDLLDAGIPLKVEKARDPWRYAFVNDGTGPKGKLYCYGIPLAHLPESILSVLRSKFGAKLDVWIPNLNADDSSEGGGA